jgi:hypothetical protein
MNPITPDIEAAATRIALAELDMLRQIETILGNLGLMTWGDDACILLRPSSGLRPPTETDFPSVGLYLLGQEYFVATVTGGPKDGAYYVVQIAQKSDDAPPPCFVSLGEAIIHVIEQAGRVAKAAEAEARPYAELMEATAAALNALATELETVTELSSETAGQDLQATQPAPPKTAPASRKKKRK